MVVSFLSPFRRYCNANVENLRFSPPLPTLVPFEAIASSSLALIRKLVSKSKFGVVWLWPTDPKSRSFHALNAPSTSCVNWQQNRHIPFQNIVLAGKIQVLWFGSVVLRDYIGRRLRSNLWSSYVIAIDPALHRPSTGYCLFHIRLAVA